MVTTEAPLPQRKTALILAVVFLVTTAVTWAAWGHVRVDMGGALHRAERLADGAILYRDIQVHYTPLAPYTMAALLAIFGKHLTVVYLTGLAILMLQSVLLWKIARRFLAEFETAIGLIAFWLLLAFQPGLFNWVLPNVFAGTFASLFATAVVAVIASDIESARSHKLIIASLLVGMTGLSKLEYGLATAVTLIFYVALLRPRPRQTVREAMQSRIGDLLRAGLPGAILATVVLGVILMTVSWDVLIFDNIYRVRSLSEVLDNYTKNLFPPLLPQLATAALCYLVVFPAAAGLAALGFRWLSDGVIDTVAGIFLLLLAASSTYLAARHWSPDEVANVYKQIQFSWAPTVWISLAAIAMILRERMGPSARWRTLAIVGVFSFVVTLRWSFRVAWPAYYAVLAPFLVVWLVRNTTTLLYPAGRERSRGIAFVLMIWVACGASAHAAQYRTKTFPLSFPRGTIYTTPKTGLPMKRTIDYLRMQTEPGAAVAVLPEEQLINFFAETPHPTTDTGVGPGWLATRDDEIRFLQQIEDAGTKFLILSRRKYPEFRAGNFASYEPWVVAQLQKTYHLEAKTQYYQIWMRNRAPSAELP
jgi:hypothetical protein